MFFSFCCGCCCLFLAKHIAHIHIISRYKKAEILLTAIASFQFERMVSCSDDVKTFYGNGYCQYRVPTLPSEYQTAG